MKESRKNYILVLIVLACVLITTCENSIIENWWVVAPSELYIDDVFQMEAKLSVIFAWIKENVTDNTNYTIWVGGDDSLKPEEGRLWYPNVSGVTITLTGMRTISITNNARGSLFNIGQEVTLVLSRNIILKGHSDNNISLVVVSKGGALHITNNASVIDNRNTNDPETTYVYVDSEELTVAGGITVLGTLIMDGGFITGNKSSGAGGIGVVDTGKFTMNGGTISGNEALHEGGGVAMWGGTFTMTGGIISRNRVTTNHDMYVIGGGGIFITSTGGSFTKTGGIIYGSDAPADLANVVVYQGDGGGDAIYVNYIRNLWIITVREEKVRNRTLYETDNISTSNWNVGWDKS